MCMSWVINKQQWFRRHSHYRHCKPAPSKGQISGNIGWKERRASKGYAWALTDAAAKVQRWGNRCRKSIGCCRETLDVINVDDSDDDEGEDDAHTTNNNKKRKMSSTLMDMQCHNHCAGGCGTGMYCHVSTNMTYTENHQLPLTVPILINNQCRYCECFKKGLFYELFNPTLWLSISPHTGKGGHCLPYTCTIGDVTPNSSDSPF